MPLKSLLLLLITAGYLQAQNAEIEQQDWLFLGVGLGVAIGMEVYGKAQLVPAVPRWKEPLSMDKVLRSKLRWQDTQDLAVKWSDRLIWGVFMSSLAWSPACSDNPREAFLLNTKIFTVNSLLTNLIKISSARQRPYAFYHTRESQGHTDNTSFFSGHASVAFSQAVGNAILLSNLYPEQKHLIWGGLLGAAALTGYLRIAGDMHYFSDVMVGAGVGSLIGWGLGKSHVKRFEGDPDAGANFTLTLKMTLG